MLDRLEAIKARCDQLGVALTNPEIVEEVLNVKLSERATRLIDGANEDSMEKKKIEGYF